VEITAQVEGQPPVAVSATLPGAGDGRAVQAAADDAAAAVVRELAVPGEAAPAVTAVATVDPGAVAPAPSIELSLDEFGASWPAVVDSLRDQTPMLAAALEAGAPAALSEEALVVAWPESLAFYKRKAEDPANRDLIVKAIRSVTGSSLRLAYELRDAAEVAPAATAAAPALSEDDLVKRFMDEFDAEELPPEPEEQT
jgi:DNA polymerase-3 subunit gamma/tau